MGTMGGTARAIAPEGGLAPEVQDGRSARAERSRRQVVEAMLDLLDEGDLDPTAQRVADRAGVSLRTVFHHFQSMETVFGECWKVQVARHWEELAAIPPTGPLAERVLAVLEQRADLFERITGPRRAAAVWSHRSVVLAHGLESSRRTLRSMLATTFHLELELAPEPEVLLDALDVATSFETWDQLRLAHGRSRTAAAAVLRHTLLALLEPVATVQEDATP